MVSIAQNILNFNKQHKGKEHPGMFLRPLNLARVAHVANFSDGKFFDRKRIKILTPKQMLQRLPIALAQVKASNISENLRNEIRQIMYSLYREKEVTKKV